MKRIRGAVLLTVAVLFGLVAAASAFAPHKGDILLTYAGSGNESYTYNVPEFDGSGGGCEFAGKHGTVTDHFAWTAKYWTSPTGAPLHHTITTSGSRTDSEVVSPCGSGPGRTQDCSASYKPDDGSSPPAGDVATEPHGYELRLGMGLILHRFSPSSCIGLIGENPYGVSDALNPSRPLRISTAALAHGFSTTTGKAVHHSCSSTDCGYQQCMNEPGSAAPGAGSVSCDATDSWKATIRAVLIK